MLWSIVFIESHNPVQDRQFIGERVEIRTIRGKRTLADLAKNEQVEIKSVSGVSV